MYDVFRLYVHLMSMNIDADPGAPYWGDLQTFLYQITRISRFDIKKLRSIKKILDCSSDN